MHRFVTIFTLYLLSSQCDLWAKVIDTFYGPIEVNEPIILDLIESEAMQRLKKVHQYGVAYYTTHTEEYTRYEHSLGVFAILRLKGLSLEEQIAGLLHDVSHTVFSHVGEKIFRFESEKDSYQDSIHEWFLKKYGIEEILVRHGYSVNQVFHKSGRFLALEQDLPNLSADRIEYNIQGAFYQGFLTKEEGREIIDDLQFVKGCWISSKTHLMKKLVEFSLYMTENCWGSAENYLMSRWLALAILLAVEQNVVSMEDIYFGTDDMLWQKLLVMRDPKVQELMYRILHARDFFSVVEVDKSELHVRTKFRGIDPYIAINGKTEVLTKIDNELSKKYIKVKDLMKQGFQIKAKSP
ncbi:MAG: HD domain-containing protein [Chlamydiae bacterium]|nr:HD domain-containing protein [Chlamydiota bacterium]